jgi:hypothetical protein
MAQKGRASVMKPARVIVRWMLGGTMVMLAPAARAWAADEAERPGAQPPAESPQVDPQVETKAAEADAQAQAWQRKADEYRDTAAFYRSGLPILEHAEDKAASYATEAADLRKPTMNEPMMAPSAEADEAEHFEQLAAHYRQIGSAYRTGFVRWAERQASEREPAGPAVQVEGGGSYHEIPPYKPWTAR